VEQTLYETGIWEPQVTRVVVDNVRPGTTVVDVGTYIGYYTLLFAKLVGSQGKVIAFEPSAGPRIYLQRSLGLNGLTNVEVCEFALYDVNGTWILAQSGAGQMEPQDPSANHASSEVWWTRVFDEWRQSSLGEVKFVKIDVEGAELGVLRGMRETIASERPDLLIEVHPSRLAAFGGSAASVLDYLHGFGYHPETVDSEYPDFSLPTFEIFCKGSG
jgi:FkbM family methyltransferase